MISKATRTLSVISLPGTKALWFSKMIVERRGFNLFARTFDTILYETLQMFIGRNSLIFVGLFILGMRAMFVLFNSIMGALKLRILRTVFITSSPIKS